MGYSVVCANQVKRRLAKLLGMRLKLADPVEGSVPAAIS